MWVVWEVASHFLEVDLWIWRILLMVGGVGWALLLDEHWWLGLGVGGVAAFLGVVADCLLLAGDAAKVHVLQSTGARPASRRTAP